MTITRETFEELKMQSIDGRVIPTINGFKAYNGGKGSGNFGHAGRPGKVGGSGKGQGSVDELTQGVAERRYHKEFEKWKSLSDELYDVGYDDTRYGLEGLHSQYQALLYHETTSDQAAKEYRKEIKDTIRRLRADVETIRDEYKSPQLAKQVEDHIEWFEKHELPKDWND